MQKPKCISCSQVSEYDIGGTCDNDHFYCYFCTENTICRTCKTPLHFQGIQLPKFKPYDYWYYWIQYWNENKILLNK